MKGFIKNYPALRMLLILSISLQFVLSIGLSNFDTSNLDASNLDASNLDASNLDIPVNFAEIRSFEAFGCEFASNSYLNNISLIFSDQEVPVSVPISLPVHVPVPLPEAPIEVNDGNIDKMIKMYSPFVIDCWKIACSPCKSMDLTINELAADYKGRIAFGKLCINRNAATAKRYGLSKAPTLLIFNNSTLVYKHVGNYPRDKLEEIILTALLMR